MTKTIELELPTELINFVVVTDEESKNIRNAMLLYPYVQNGTISHRKAAEILGIRKLDLITLYGKMGLTYFDESQEELEEDIQTIKGARGEILC